MACSSAGQTVLTVMRAVSHVVALLLPTVSPVQVDYTILQPTQRASPVTQMVIASLEPVVLSVTLRVAHALELHLINA